MKPNVVHRKSGIVFEWMSDVQSYEPISHNLRQNEYGEWESDDIQKGDIFWEFVAFIRHSSMVVDKRTGAKSPGENLPVTI